MSTVSVVIPTYNEERYIQTCLTHLVQQTEMPDEIILVDNNCTDKTIEIAKTFPQVTVIPEPKQGMIFARNAGMNAATGEIIARCDADSQAPPTWIQKIKKSMTEQQLDATSGPIWYYDYPPGSAAMCRFYMWGMLHLQGFPTLLGPNLGISKKMWLKIADSVCMDDKRVHEDIDLGIHVARAGGKIAYDWTNIMPTSARRLKSNPASFYGEYVLRLISTLRTTHQAAHL